LKHPGAKPAQEVCAAAGMVSAAVKIIAAIDTQICDRVLVVICSPRSQRSPLLHSAFGFTATRKSLMPNALFWREEILTAGSLFHWYRRKQTTKAATSPVYFFVPNRENAPPIEETSGEITNLLQDPDGQRSTSGIRKTTVTKLSVLGHAIHLGDGKKRQCLVGRRASS
jgi:hypothetical protein